MVAYSFFLRVALKLGVKVGINQLKVSELRSNEPPTTIDPTETIGIGTCSIFGKL